MKRLVAMVVAAGAAMAAVAMPTKAELQKAQTMVKDVTAADVAALKTKSKTPVEVAAKHMELAGQAGNEAEKYVLLQGAFKLYAKAGDYEGAANALGTMNREIADMNPEVIVEIYNKAIFSSMKEKAPKLHAIKEAARRQVTYRKQLAKAEAAVKANPKDPAAQKKLGECHAELGNWSKALDAFALAGGALAKTAAAEKDGTAAPQVSGDFWWGYESGDEMSTYKLHAAELYRKALADDSFKGLARTRAEQRVKEVAGNAAAVAADGQGASPRAPGANGLYCVIELSGGPDAKKYPVSYLNDMPKGGWSDEYKTTKLVLRRIEPGAFMMGSGNDRHSEKIDKAYYLGVFEVTQKQWELVMGNRPSYFGGPSWRVRPVDQISYDTIRGKQEGMKWPASDAVDSDSFLGIVRQKSGLRFDLPTQEQWEYACRAGAKTDFYNGKVCINDEHDSSLDGLARYAHTGGWNESWGSNNNKSRWDGFWKAPDRNCETTSGTATVGAYQPNNWGLYDMLGNVREWCLQKGEKGINLGGCWIDGADACKVYSVNQIAKHRGRHDFGFRLCLPLAGGALASASATTPTTGSIELKTGGDSPFTVKGNEATLELKNGAKLEFVKCPAGKYKMGFTESKSCLKYHSVAISRPFWMAKLPMAYKLRDGILGKMKRDDGEKGQPAFRLDVLGGDNAPAAITYNQALDVLKRLNQKCQAYLPGGYVLRMPSEAEYEYAAKSGRSEYNVKTDGAGEITLFQDRLRALQDKGFEAVKWDHFPWRVPYFAVGSKKANDWGLYDMFTAGWAYTLDSVNCKRETDTEALTPYYVDDSVDPVQIESGDGKLLLGVVAGCGWGYYDAKYQGRSWVKFLIERGDARHDDCFLRIVIGPDLVSEWKAKNAKK